MDSLFRKDSGQIGNRTQTLVALLNDKKKYQIRLGTNPQTSIFSLEIMCISLKLDN